MPPDAWTENAVPETPGFYLMRCLDQSGVPISAHLTLDPVWDDDMQRRMRLAAEQFGELIYIGKAANLRERFWEKLIQSWWSGKPATPLHDSRKNWNDSQQLQQRLPLSGMQCRFVQIGSKPMKPNLSAKAQEMSDLFGWTEKDARNTNQPTTAAVQVAEATMLFKYIRVFGTPPPLNIKGPDRPGPIATIDWVIANFGHEDETPDPDVEMQPLDYEELRARIQAIRQQRGQS